MKISMCKRRFLIYLSFRTRKRRRSSSITKRTDRK